MGKRSFGGDHVVPNLVKSGTISRSFLPPVELRDSEATRNLYGHGRITATSSDTTRIQEMPSKTKQGCERTLGKTNLCDRIVL